MRKFDWQCRNCPWWINDQCTLPLKDEEKECENDYKKYCAWDDEEWDEEK